MEAKDRVSVAEFLGIAALRVLWALNLMHVPQWDNVPNPYKKSKITPAVEPTTTQKATPKTDATQRTLEYGKADPTQAPTMVQYLEEKVVEPGADLGWTYARFDGKFQTHNFKDWHRTDDEVITERGYTERTRMNYIAMRPYVIEGKSNSYIADKLGKSLSTVENYAGAVREAFRRRAAALDSPSPTE